MTDSIRCLVGSAGGMGMGRILVVTPVTAEVRKGLGEALAHLPLPAGVEVDHIRLDWGPSSVETVYDEVFAAAATLEAVGRRMGEVPADVVVVNCFADPGLHALRELFDVPVVGAGEASCLFAAMLAPKFAVVSVLANAVPHTELRLRALGLESRLARAYGIEFGVEELGDGERVTAAIVRCAVEAVREYGADAVVLGCTGMAPLVDDIRREVPVPVVEPTATAVWCAAALAHLGLRHGRVHMYLRADPGKVRTRDRSGELPAGG